MPLIISDKAYIYLLILCHKYFCVFCAFLERHSSKSDGGLRLLLDPFR